MTTFEFTDDEIELMRNALTSYLDDFTHDEMDLLRRIQALRKKLGEDLDPSAA